MCNHEEPKDLDVFESLNRYSFVIFYNKMDDEISNFLKYVDQDDYTMIKFESESEDPLYLACMSHYKPIKVPFLLYRAGLIYSEECIPERIEQIDKENIEKCTTFIQNFVLNEGVTLFMKGSILNPKCRFSRQLASLIIQYGIKNIKSFDILEDPILRHYMKKIMEWPTFPQIFINGEFYGGLDAFVELHGSGQLEKLLNKSENAL